jgi:hypothetical protein
MRFANVPYLLFGALLVTGCADLPQRPPAPEFDPDYVVQRIDDLEARPEWLMESSPFVVQSGTVISLGQTEIPGDHRLEAAYRIAENNAAATISGAIQKKLDFIFQNAEEGTGLDRWQVRFIGGEASRLMTSSLQPGKHYWEKVAYTSSTGRVSTKYRVFATVEMPEEDFRRAILDALRRTSGRTGLSEDFADKVDEHWDELTSARAPLPQPPADDGAETSIEIPLDDAPPAPPAAAAPLLRNTPALAAPALRGAPSVRTAPALPVSEAAGEAETSAEAAAPVAPAAPIAPATPAEPATSAAPAAPAPAPAEKEAPAEPAATELPPDPGSAG